MAGNLYEQGYYETGSASVTQGQTVVTGQGTAWSQIVRPADDFGKHVGMPVPIASVDSDTQITLAFPWPGPTQAAAPYRVSFTPYYVNYRQALLEIGQLLVSGNVSALASLVGAANRIPMFTGPGALTLLSKEELTNGVYFDVLVDNLAGRAAYDLENTGFTVFVADVGDGRSAIYTKSSAASADWSDPAYITGPKGATGHEAYVYIGYASDAAGADFTTAYNPALDYIAILASEVEIPAPSAEDFAGLWFNYKGEKGDTGEAGADWLTGAADPAPGDGFDGDLYLQTGDGATGFLGDVWQKSAGTWVVVSNIRGAAGSGTGDVIGPNGGVGNGELVLFDGPTGKGIKGSGKTLGDFAPAVPSLGVYSNANPIYIAHRNQAQLYPDQSLGAFREFAKSPVVGALECDVRQLSDGTLVCFHDFTLDRITTSTGSVEALTEAQFRALRIDAENWHGSNIPDGSTTVVFADALKEFNGKKPFMIEVKTAGAGQAVADALVAAGIPKGQAVISSVNLSDVTPSMAAGYEGMALANDDSIIAAAQSAGVQWVALRDNENDAEVAAWVSTGFKVVMWTVHRRYRRDHLLGLGVVGFYTDDCEYLARDEPIYTADQFREGTWMPGMLAQHEAFEATRRGRFFGGGWGASVEADPHPGPGLFVLQGWACPVVENPSTDSFTFEAELVFIGSSLPGTGSWAGIALADSAMKDQQVLDGGASSDFPSPASEKIWNCLFRQTGQLDIYKRTGPSVTREARTETAEISPGTSFNVRVIVTPASIRTHRVSPDGVVLGEAMVADGDYRGAYIHLGVRSASEWLVKNVKVALGEAAARPVGGARSPFIVEQGEAADSRYIKWSDGRLDVWCESVSLTASEAVGNVYRSPSVTYVNFPVPFVGRVYCSSGYLYTGGASGWEAITYGPGDNAAAIGVRIYGHSSSAEGKVVIHATGRWR